MNSSLTNKIAAFIENTPWTVAKTYTQSPHEYHIFDEFVEHYDEEGFYRLVSAIHTHGYKRTFNGRQYSYLRIGTYEYWAMLTTDGKMIINRRKVSA